MLLAHPGGPFWRDRDAGAWTIPKGIVDEGEELLDAARREFEEETGIRPRVRSSPLGSVRQKAGKVVHAWAWEGDADASAIVSNTARVEWPPGSGRWITYPEVDRCAWFDPEAARAADQPGAGGADRAAGDPRWRSRAAGDRSPPEAAEPLRLAGDS